MANSALPNALKQGATIGILGGGQLGRMIAPMKKHLLPMSQPRTQSAPMKM